MIALRLLLTALTLVAVVWLLKAGFPLGGLVIVPLLAVWLRRKLEARAGVAHS